MDRREFFAASVGAAAALCGVHGAQALMAEPKPPERVVFRRHEWTFERERDGYVDVYKLSFNGHLLVLGAGEYTDRVRCIEYMVERYMALPNPTLMHTLYLRHTDGRFSRAFHDVADWIGLWHAQALCTAAEQPGPSLNAHRDKMHHALNEDPLALLLVMALKHRVQKARAAKEQS